MPAETVDEPADPDAPDPRAHLALAAVPLRALPHRHERVLDDLLDEAGIGAPAREAEGEPGRVPLVEQPQRPAVAGRDLPQEVLIRAWLVRSCAHLHPLS